MKIGLVGNIKKPRVRSVIQDFVACCERRNLEYLYASELASFLNLPDNAPMSRTKDLGLNCDVVVAFGGDGTILSTAKEVGQSGVPILGVNMGGLGFLAEVVVEELDKTLNDLMSGKFSIIERMMLKIEFFEENKKSAFSAFNDVVVEKGTGPRLIQIDVTVNGDYLNTYRSDGLIIATPTGSTAYSLSAGGPLLMPTMNAIVVTPICPHSLSVRPIVLSDQSLIEISIHQDQEPAQVNLDGKNIFKLYPGKEIKVCKAPFNVKWVSIGQRDFFKILRTKLNWVGDNVLKKGT